MAELINIKDERFWEILFDEACVEGQQAERIERKLKAMTVTEAEIRNKAIDEFAEALYKKSTDLKDIEDENYGMLHYEEIYELAEWVRKGEKE